MASGSQHGSGGFLHTRTHVSNRHSHMPSSSRHRSLPRPKRTKRPVRRVRSATRRYPETTGALPEPKEAPSARIGPTDEVGHR
eukprot:6619972-Prymnesium_polylepis.1